MEKPQYSGDSYTLESIDPDSDNLSRDIWQALQGMRPAGKPGSRRSLHKEAALPIIVIGLSKDLNLILILICITTVKRRFLNFKRSLLFTRWRPSQRNMKITMRRSIT